MTEPDIIRVEDPARKAGICDELLHALPDWFGIEEAIVSYVRQAAQLPFWAAVDGEAAVGFAAVQPHGRYAAELCVMGIRREYHRRGLGRRLVSACERYCRETGVEFFTVKTLDESREDSGYESTRRFYLAMGFRPLEVFKTLWGESNPCLMLVKYLGP